MTTWSLVKQWWTSYHSRLMSRRPSSTLNDRDLERRKLELEVSHLKHPWLGRLLVVTTIVFSLWQVNAWRRESLARDAKDDLDRFTLTVTMLTDAAALNAQTEASNTVGFADAAETKVLAACSIVVAESEKGTYSSDQLRSVFFALCYLMARDNLTWLGEMNAAGEWERAGGGTEQVIEALVRATGSVLTAWAKTKDQTAASTATEIILGVTNYNEEKRRNRPPLNDLREQMKDALGVELP